VTNPQFFINNAANGMDLGPQVRDTSLDGLTVVLTATATVTPGVINHIKLAITDVTDSAFDSDVFIKAGSFNAPKPLPKFYYPFRYIFDAGTQTFRGNLTFANIGNDVQPGPFFIVFPQLPTGVTLLNATGKSKAGAPYIFVNVGSLPAGKLLRIPLVFR